MQINNWPKFILLIVMAICVTVLTAVNKIAGEAALAFYGMELTYIIGNGIAAKRDQPIEPVLTSKDHTP